MAGLSGTSYVILGMLGWRPMSGYEIKGIVDGSTRLFWAASYGQIYPELRRLGDAGLIAGRSDPKGGRKRNVYRLTAAGRRELRDWLHTPPEVFELRDEGILKLFFASSTDGASAIGTLDAKRAKHEAVLARLRQIEDAGKPEGYAGLVLGYGIEFNEWQVAWCDRAARELRASRKAAA